MFNDRHPEEGETPAFKGSMAIYQAESIEEVRNLLSQDVYAREGVWDLEATTIVPVSFFSISFLWFVMDDVLTWECIVQVCCAAASVISQQDMSMTMYTAAR